MSEMEDLLGNLEETYKEVDAAGDQGFEIPEGNYVGIVQECEICKSNSSDRIHIKMPIKIAKGKHKNFTHYSYDLRFTSTDGQPDTVAMSFFKRACSVLGIAVPVSVKEAPTAVALFKGRVIEFTIVKSKDKKFTNVRLQRLIHDNDVKWIDAGMPDPKEANQSASDNVFGN